MRHAGIQHIIRIHKQDAVVRIDLREAPKSRQLVLIKHDPAVRHGTAYRDAEFLTGCYGGGSVHAADIAGSRAEDRRVVIVRAPGAEIRDRTPPGRPYDAVRLCRDQALVVHLR